MAEQEKSFFDYLSLARDVAVAKRSQPRLVQGAEHSQTPIRQNVQAPREPTASVTSSPFGMMTSKQMLLAGVAGIAALVVIAKVVKR